MSMEKEALDRIAELARAEVAVEKIDGMPMAARQLHDCTPSLHPPETLAVHTLSGLVGYLEANRDAIKPAGVVVQVEGPRRVRVVSGIRGKRNERFVYAHAETPDVVRGLFGTFISAEEFNVRIMSMFVDDGDRAEVVQLAGCIQADENIKLQDDGFTQEITAKGGVSLMKKAGVKNPMNLSPFRTFREVKQPMSPFLFRVRGDREAGISCALFEADGGAWELDAIANVVEWLGEQLGDDYKVIG